MAADHAICPRCDEADELSLLECHEEWGSTDPGRILKDARGDLVPPTVFEFFVGDPISVLVQCSACGHEWKPRKGSVSSNNLSEELAERARSHR